MLFQLIISAKDMPWNSDPERLILRLVIIRFRLYRFAVLRLLLFQTVEASAARHLSAGQLLRRDPTEAAAIAMNQPERIGIQETLAQITGDI